MPFIHIAIGIIDINAKKTKKPTYFYAGEGGNLSFYSKPAASLTHS